ncbi:zf-HC2 domain-containing protein [Amycolatopsis sp. CA-230715]|uniref:zf-HC2 domain-containing protein n=1 Tax=Amycolatopsis sp. CA-230715 TaxID=2745196 RepID=UPI001C01D052|nr:zf-HC2 domain-containing protein [Amycolatopsis sp. CA-230715]
MTDRTSGGHVSAELIERYALGQPVPPEAEWAVEAHLEGCALCRAKLAEVVRSDGPAVSALVDSVWSSVDSIVDAEVVRRPKALGHNRFAAWLSTWATPAMVPWIGMSVLVTAIALLFDVIGVFGGSRPSLLLLLSPVLPLFGVAAVWTRGLDPAWELVAGTPRSGLYLVLRRTLSVLVVVLPALVVAGVLAGTSPALGLLPCLAFTAGTLALGGFVGVTRASIAVGGLWCLFVVGPALFQMRLPTAFEPWAMPIWGAVALLAAAVLVLRAPAFTKLTSQR